MAPAVLVAENNQHHRLAVVKAEARECVTHHGNGGGFLHVHWIVSFGIRVGAHVSGRQPGLVFVDSSAVAEGAAALALHLLAFFGRLVSPALRERDTRPLGFLDGYLASEYVDVCICYPGVLLVERVEEGYRLAQPAVLRVGLLGFEAHGAAVAAAVASVLVLGSAAVPREPDEERALGSIVVIGVRQKCLDFITEEVQIHAIYKFI